MEILKARDKTQAENKNKEVHGMNEETMYKKITFQR